LANVTSFDQPPALRISGKGKPQALPHEVEADPALLPENSEVSILTPFMTVLDHLEIVELP